MPKKVAQTPTEPKQPRRKVSPQAETDEQAQAQVAPPKTRAKKAAAVADTTPAVPPAVADTTPAPTADTTTAPSARHAPTRESVEREFDELVASIDEEIGKLRATASKSKGVKFLRTLNKRVKTLRTHALRVSRQRAGTRRSNTNSGFLKPVQISKDLAKFTGWDHSQLRSRVDVTKFICEYIKSHDLQDPADKRRIRVENDPSLKKLLKYEAGKDTKPLTYYSLQSYLKNHFTSPAAAPAQ